MKKKSLYLFITSLIIILLDQVTKALILKDFQEGQSLTVIQNYFDITYVRNYGAAFGLFSKIEPGFRDTFFLIIPPVAMIVILFMLKTANQTERLKILALCSVFAGAIGNYMDRLRFGYVVDFLDFHYYKKWIWPAFNVADMSIVCGIFILIIIELLSSTKPSKTTSSKQSNTLS